MDIIGAGHGFFQRIDRGCHGDRQEHLILPEIDVFRDFRHNGRSAEISLIKFTTGQDLAAGEDLPDWLNSSLNVMVVTVGGFIDHRSHVGSPSVGSSPPACW